MPVVDVSGGFVAIDTVAAGLVENEDDDDAPSDGEFDKRPRGPRDAGGNR